MTNEYLSQFNLLHPRQVDLNLMRLQRLLKQLGDPQLGLPAVIHVAGTNGKGSTIAYLRACLEEAGYRVHTYTSPHLVRFNERIRLNGHLITDEQLDNYLAVIARVNAGCDLTFFEATTAAAFLAFKDHPADIILLETGMGGRLDATNIIMNPLACVITPVSYDHQDYLGETIQEIATEKAGIIKAGTKVIVAKQNYDVEKVLRRAIYETKSTGYVCGSEWQFDFYDDALFVTVNEDVFVCQQPALNGAHQYSNAATAIITLKAIADEFPVSLKAMNNGLEKAYWPGRLQNVTAGKLKESLSTGQELWLDGAHNPDGVQALRAAVGQWPHKELTLCLALLKNRDPKMFIEFIKGHVESLVLIDMQEPQRFHECDYLKHYFVDYINKNAIKSTSVKEFPQFLKNNYVTTPRILCTGSLYLVGALLDINETLPC